MKIYVLIGPPGAGKSTWVENQSDLIIISTDKIREILNGNAEDQSNGKLVFETAYSCFQEAIKESYDEGYDVAFDATNCRKRNRKELLLKIPIRTDATVIGVWFQTPLKECLRRNAMRSRHVPQEVIIRMFEQLQKDPPDLAEGFDEIVKIEEGSE